MSGSSFTQPLTGFRWASTRTDDTMQKIAVRELGDMSRWVDLVNLNGLLPPYLTTSLEAASPTCLFAGSPMKIPSPAPAASAVTDPDVVFGIDAMLVDGDLTADAGGDIATISGVPNLSQALYNRLETHPEDLLQHPTYGCDVYELVGKGASSSIGLLAASRVARSIRADPRISSVENAVASIAGDVVASTADAITVDGKVVPTGIG
jgi:phage baseplate assembly protein W